MKMYVGLTDFDWYNTLKDSNCDEVNFWKPGGKTNFKALKEGELFLFKLHSPQDYIVGGGFFLKFISLPSSLSWEAFGIANGTNSLIELKNRIYKYRNSSRLREPDPEIGCIILSMPFYFERDEWITVPFNWSKNIVQGKTYDTSEQIGLELYQSVQNRLSSFIHLNERYGNEQIMKPRLGQGSFKIAITETYHRKCAITGEKTLPVLEAAHIKPYSLDGPHEISNGLLLRRDFHTLFDRGYLTIDKNYNIEVSKHIKEDFGNGREYYAHHGKKLINLPEHNEQRPNKEFLIWHNDNVYLG